MERRKKIPGLQIFANRYMKHKLPMNWHHQLNYDILENKVIQKEDGLLYPSNYTDAEGNLHDIDSKKWQPTKINQNILALEPRFHSKSQNFTIEYALWEIYKNPNVRIIIVSANEAIAVSFNRAIMNQLLYNQELIKELGYLVPEYQERNKWGEKALQVKRTSLDKDPTISAIGVGGGLISKRADIIIVDDVIDIKTARTKAARKKTQEWYENVLLPILEDDGRMIVVGTTWYRGDIYDTLWKESHFDIKMKLKALIYHPTYIKTRETTFLPYRIHEWPQALNAGKLFSEELMIYYNLYEKLKGGTLWEEKWSYQKLINKKTKGNMSNSAFNRQYLNEPTSQEEALFKKTFLDQALQMGNQKTLLPNWDNSSPQQGYGYLVIAAGVDLAISKTDRSDESAIAVWGINANRVRIPLWLDSGKWSTDETKEKIIQMNYNFRPVKIRVENVAFQDMFRQEISEEESLPVEGFKTTATRKFNEDTGLNQVAMLTEQELMLLPNGQKNMELYQRVMSLLDDMTSYVPEQHAGDMLMASWFALDALADFDQKMRENRGFFSVNAMIDQMRQIKAPHKIVLLGNNPPVFKFAVNSLIYIYRSVKMGEPFFTPEEEFFIFATREQRGVAYIFNKLTNEIVGKIDGDLSALMYATILEKTGKFFNNAQLVIDKNGEGKAILTELEKRFYPKLLCLQPDKHGTPIPEEGFEIDESNLPLSVSYFKQQVDEGQINIPDDVLLREMGQTIGVDNRTMKMGYGTGQKVKTAATALWIIDNYENLAKKMYNQTGGRKKKKKKYLDIPYRVFRK